jgi:hypothetical protein
LLTAKYTAPVKAHTHTKTAIPLFIVFISTTFHSTDGVVATLVRSMVSDAHHVVA